MKTRYLSAAALAIALLVTTGVRADEHNQFDDHDRQVVREWHSQHQDHPARGLRSQDRLTAEQESRLERGRAYDRDLRRKAYSVPSDLRHRLPPPPRHHVYVMLGGHVVLVDSEHNILRDVIHLH